MACIIVMQWVSLNHKKKIILLDDYQKYCTMVMRYENKISEQKRSNTLVWDGDVKRRDDSYLTVRILSMKVKKNEMKKKRSNKVWISVRRNDTYIYEICNYCDNS